MNVLLSEMRDATLLLTLNRPSARNALCSEMREALGEQIQRARDDSSVKAVVLIGAGDSFCAGGDLRDLSKERRTPWESRERVRKLHLWFRDLVNLEKPVIAAVDGSSFGAGFSLALAADFVLATPRARFCQVFGRIGALPDLGSLYLLPRIVGLQRAKDLIFTAREIEAAEALSLGIVFEIRPAETLLEDALKLAAMFHAASTEALGMAKNILNQSFQLDQNALIELEASTQAIAFASDYHLAAVDRFLGKKPPRFSWRDPFEGSADEPAD